MLITKPPMGWNSWNTFNSAINEQVVRETAETMAANGLKDAGYEYVVIDDCWALNDRDEKGRLVSNPEKFPSGMRVLSDYVHSLGLKFGMYSCAGMRTCTGFPGSFDREFIDAQTFAEWGVDYLKYDFCYFPHDRKGMSAYNKMSMALKATGRDIVFSVCNWGVHDVKKWARSIGAHLWRSTGDISERFTYVRDIATSQYDNFCFTAPGCYNDMDMLICGMDGIGPVGHPGACGDIEYKTHFAMWCMANAPLMIGSDVRRIRPETLKLLTNPDLIRINQDEECRAPIVVTTRGELCPTFFKHLSDKEVAIGFFNFGDDRGNPDFRPWDLGFPTTAGFGLKLREIFSGETIDYVDDYFEVQLEPHDCKVYVGTYVPKT